MGTDMEDILTSCEGTCQKPCHLPVPAQALDEDVTSCSSGSRTRRYQKTWFANTVQRGCGIGNGNDAEPCTPDVLHRTLRDIILITLRIVPAQSQTSPRGDHIPPQILTLSMMQSGKHYREGPQQQESQGIPSLG